METIIVSLEEIASGTINEELYQLCSNKKEEVIKYENYIAKKIFTKIDKNQFAGVYPEDLKEAAINLIQNLFIFSISGKNSVAWWRLTGKTEKIDDYSISESYQHYSPYTFFWIPIDKETMEIIESYWATDFNYWNWEIDLH